MFQWWKNKSQMWHGCCSLPVLPAASNHLAGGNNCRLYWNHTTCQSNWRTAGWVLSLQDTVTVLSVAKLYSGDLSQCLSLGNMTADEVIASSWSFKCVFVKSMLRFLAFWAFRVTVFVSIYLHFSYTICACFECCLLVIHTKGAHIFWYNISDNITDQ